MTKTIYVLAVVLAAQLALAVGLRFTAPDLTANADSVAMLNVDLSQIDEIAIDGPDGDRVTLAKVDGAWRLPERRGYPANGQRIERLLAELEDLTQGLPVATTTEARRRFEVDDEAFERRIVLRSADEMLATLYLGTSPSVREVHARVHGEDAIYAVELATYDVPATFDSWEDKTILQVAESDIEAIDVAGLSLSRIAEAAVTPSHSYGSQQADAGDSLVPQPEQTEGPAGSSDVEDSPSAGSWQAANLAPGESIDVEAVDKLIGLMANLRIGTVLGWDEEPGYGLDSPTLELTLTRSGGRQARYRVGKSTEAEEYVLHVSTRDEYFRLPTYTAEPLIDAAARDALLSSGDAANEDTAAEIAEKL